MDQVKPTEIIVNARELINKLQNLSNYYLYEIQDPRTKGMFLLGSPVPAIIICVAWLYFVLRAGPRFMRDRKPYQLKSAIQAYNIFQVLINTYLSYEFIDGAWLNGYTLPCTNFDPTNSPQALRIIRASYIAYILKLVDFLDTIFYVLRRKDNQISFLHVYHHLGLPFVGFLTLKYGPGGQSLFSVTINSMVHVIMYMYYMLAAMGPKIQPYLWWKRYLTAMQLIQFILQLAHVSYLYLDTSCYYPGNGMIRIFFIPYVIGLFILFSNFYVQSYLVTNEAKTSIYKKTDGDVNPTKYISHQLPAVLNPCKQVNLYS